MTWLLIIIALTCFFTHRPLVISLLCYESRFQEETKQVLPAVNDGGLVMTQYRLSYYQALT
jgi:hypothetical protein